MPYYRKLIGDKCFLAPIQIQDAEDWALWLNDLDIALPLGDEAYMPYSLDKVREEAAEAIRRQDHIFTIVDSQKEKAIGRCLLFGIDSVNHNAMLGIFIGEKSYWHKGYGGEATQLLLDYAFNLLNLHSIMLGVFEFNHHAIQLYEKIGFKQVGLRREARLIAGKAWSVVLMDILEDEFRRKWKTVIPTVHDRSEVEDNNP
jgi:RimJ/RimL family protein N-acetyltransferase